MQKKVLKEDLVEKARKLRQKKVWVHKAKSFEEANAFDEAYYASMTPEERLETMGYLLEIYCKMKNHVYPPRLQRTVKIIRKTRR